MPRISDGRPPAEPSSEGQKARHQRMLDAAMKLGSELDFDRVQMQDVAGESGVAIATLYRYFPSKTDLFVGVMRSELEKLDPTAYAARPGQEPVEAIGDLLMMLTRTMSRNRRLSMSMIQSLTLSEGRDNPDAIAIERLFLKILLGIAGWGADPTLDQRRRVWLVIQCWFGVLITTLRGNRKIEAADADIRRACELLLA